MYIKVTTEGDCEGRTTSTVGIFKAHTQEQVAHWLVKSGITPYYNFTFSEVHIEDVTHVAPKVAISKGPRGTVNIHDSSLVELNNAQIKEAALNKLSKVEKEILGL